MTYNYINDVNLAYTEVLQVNGKEKGPLHTYIYGVQRIQDDKKGERTQYYNYDGKGSVIGKQVGNDLHLAFKVKYNDDGKPSRNMDNEFGYNGEAHDYHGTQYLRARYYDTNIGRFNQRDPYRGELRTPISQNRYTYVWNNALKYHDKSGNKLLLDHGRQDPKLDETVNLQDYYYQQHKNGKISDEAYHRSEAEIWRDYQNNRNPAEILPANERNPNYPTLSEYIKEQERLAEKAKQRMKDEIKAIEDELKAAGIIVAKWNIAGYSTEEKLRILREIKKICEELGMGTEHFDKTKAQQEVDNYVADNKYTPWDFTKKSVSTWYNQNKADILRDLSHLSLIGGALAIGFALISAPVWAPIAAGFVAILTGYIAIKEANKNKDTLDPKVYNEIIWNSNIGTLLGTLGFSSPDTIASLGQLFQTTNGVNILESLNVIFDSGVGTLNPDGLIVLTRRFELVIPGITVANPLVLTSGTYTLADVLMMATSGNGGDIKTPLTNTEATKLAKELGYRKTNYLSDGKAVYYNPKGNPKYITIDRTAHNGGVWKGANKIVDLGSKETRLGTYDKNLNRIGD